MTAEAVRIAADAPLLMAVDGNSLLHRAFHAHRGSDQRDSAGAPVWALRGALVAIGGAAARLRPDAVLVAFDCPDVPARRAQFAAYKASRPAKPDDLVAQLASMPDLLRDAGVGVVQHTGAEADDVLASAVAGARAAGWRSSVVTSDRDAFALIDGTTSVLRVISGGIEASTLLNPARLEILCGVRPDQYRDLAALRGDSSDNLPGARGIGAKTAARLLQAFEHVAEVYAALDSGRSDEVEAAIGATGARRLAEIESRANVARNLELMRMRDDVPVPDPGSMRVPLEVPRLQRALRARDIHLGPSLWALTGGAAPGEGQWTWLAEQGHPGTEDLVAVGTSAVRPDGTSVLQPAGTRQESATALTALLRRSHRSRSRRRAVLVDEAQLSLF